MDESPTAAEGIVGGGSIRLDQCPVCSHVTSESDDVMAHSCGQTWHSGCFLMQLDHRKKVFLRCSCREPVRSTSRVFYPGGRSNGESIKSSWPGLYALPLEQENAQEQVLLGDSRA